MNDQIEIKDLDQGVPVQADWLVFQKVSDGVVYKAPKSDIEGEDAFVYIAYADDDIGTGFTLTFDANKDYIAIKSTNTEIANPVVGDFAGLWKNYKGIKGDTGDNATADAGTTTTIAPGQPATVTNVGTTSDAVFDFAIPQGEKGACVVSVAFVGNDMVFTLDDTSTVTLVGAKTDLEGDKGDTGASIVSVAFNGNDIVFTKDDLTTVTLTNGKTILTGPKGDTGVGITSIVKTSTLGLVDTYTINYDDTTTTTFNVTNGAKGDTGDTGNGIASVVKTATVGLVDTYTITFTDLTTFEYDVTNGKDGAGSGDVIGPASATADNIAVFDGITGKLIKDGGATIASKQDALGFTPENVANKSTTLDTDKASDTKYPSVKSVYDWATGLFQTLANKVTSFQTTPDDSHYPSEKLTYDQLALKASLTGAETLTNKRITKRVASTTDDATAVLDCDSYDEYYLTAIANATEISITGTPTAGQTILVGLKDAGSAKALTWTGITAVGVELPTTTVAGKQHIIGLKYISSAWKAIAVGVEA